MVIISLNRLIANEDDIVMNFHFFQYARDRHFKEVVLFIVSGEIVIVIILHTR